MRTDSIATPSVDPSGALLSVTADTARTNTVVITVCGDIDMLTGPLLLARLRERIHPSGPGVVVDLTGVRYFGAAGITALLRARTTARAAGVDVVVVAAGQVVLMPLRVTGMEGAFDLYPTLSDALGRPGSIGRPVLSD